MYVVNLTDVNESVVCGEPNQAASYNGLIGMAEAAISKGCYI